MTVVAKFRLAEEKRTAHGDRSVYVTFYAVSGDSEENKTWAKYTPSGRIEMQIDNPAAADAFDLGAEYIVRFEKVEKPE